MGIKWVRKKKEYRKNQRTKAGAQTAVCLAAACGITAAGVIPAAAAPIKSVKLRLEAEEFDEQGKPLLEIVSLDDSYTVVGLEPLNEETPAGSGPGANESADRENPESEEDGQDEKRLKKESETDRDGEEGENASLSCQYQIELAAEEEDGFGVMEQSSIRFLGEPAICTKAVRRDSGQTLLLTMELEEPEEILGEIERVSLDGAAVRWSKAANAAAYLVMFYRDGRRLGYVHRTEACSYDAAALLRQPGVYDCRVIPLSLKGRKGKAAESGSKRVEEKEAAEIEAQWADSPAGEAWKRADGLPGWRQTGRGWVYLQKDGTLPQNNWMELDGDRYYFDENGLMERECWRLSGGVWYYVGEDGRAQEANSF